jgi:hypothetical protein
LNAPAGIDPFTVRVSVVLLVNAPDVPVIVTVTGPVAAVALAVKVSVLLVVAALGLKAAVTPLGKPDEERATLPLKPFCGVMVTVLVPWPSCAMVTLLGEGESVKDGDGLLLEPPPHPTRINAT